VFWQQRREIIECKLGHDYKLKWTSFMAPKFVRLILPRSTKCKIVYLEPKLHRVSWLCIPSELVWTRLNRVELSIFIYSLSRSNQTELTCALGLSLEIIGASFRTSHVCFLAWFLSPVALLWPHVIDLASSEKFLGLILGYRPWFSTRILRLLFTSLQSPFLSFRFLKSLIFVTAGIYSTWYTYRNVTCQLPLR